MRVSFDTCVIIDLAAGDNRAAASLSWVAHAQPLVSIFTDFARGEVAGVIARRVRQGELSAEEGRGLLGVIDEGVKYWQRELLKPEDIALATDLLLRFEANLRLPDAIHLAAARRLDATLVTSDRKLVGAARKFGLAAVDPFERV